MVLLGVQKYFMLRALKGVYTARNRNADQFADVFYNKAKQVLLLLIIIWMQDSLTRLLDKGAMANSSSQNISVVIICTLI